MRCDWVIQKRLSYNVNASYTNTKTHRPSRSNGTNGVGRVFNQAQVAPRAKWPQRSCHSFLRRSFRSFPERHVKKHKHLYRLWHEVSKWPTRNIVSMQPAYSKKQNNNTHTHLPTTAATCNTARRTSRWPFIRSPHRCATFHHGIMRACGGLLVSDGGVETRRCRNNL